MSKKTIRDSLRAPTHAEPALHSKDDPSQKRTVRDLSQPFVHTAVESAQFEDFFSAKKTIKMRTAPFAEQPEAEPPPASDAFRTPDEQLFGRGKRIGSYVIEGVIDPGGEVARVYKARHSFTEGRPAAIKVLLTRHAGRKDLMAKMHVEANALSRVSHPNVVAFYDANVLDDLVWIAEEYIEGPNGRELIERSGGLALDEALSIIYQIGAGLAAAHDQGILHLDVKPENLISSQAGVKLVDLGAAKFLSDSGSNSTRVAGTPHYMAPERFAQGATPDERSDIYSLALVLYELVTGRHALTTKRGLSDEHLEWLQCRMAPTMAPQFSFQLWEVLASALAKDPERRPRNVREFLTRLKKAAAQVPSTPDISSAPTTVVKRWVEGSALLGATVGLLVGAALYFLAPLPLSRSPNARVSAAASPEATQITTRLPPAVVLEPLPKPPRALPVQSAATATPQESVVLPVIEQQAAPHIAFPSLAMSAPPQPRPLVPTQARRPALVSANAPAPTAPGVSNATRRNLEISNEMPF